MNRRHFLSLSAMFAANELASAPRPLMDVLKINYFAFMISAKPQSGFITPENQFAGGQTQAVYRKALPYEYIKEVILYNQSIDKQLDQHSICHPVLLPDTVTHTLKANYKQGFFNRITKGQEFLNPAHIDDINLLLKQESKLHEDARIAFILNARDVTGFFTNSSALSPNDFKTSIYYKGVLTLTSICTPRGKPQFFWIPVDHHHPMRHFGSPDHMKIGDEGLCYQHRTLKISVLAMQCNQGLTFFANKDKVIKASQQAEINLKQHCQSETNQKLYQMNAMLS